MSKDLSFARFFNPEKSLPRNGSGIHQAQKRHGNLFWDSSRKGTYYAPKRSTRAPNNS
jgi:hypothetical protein